VFAGVEQLSREAKGEAMSRVGKLFTWTDPATGFVDVVLVVRDDGGNGTARACVYSPIIETPFYTDVPVSELVVPE
jgi:hypothetical protein